MLVSLFDRSSDVYSQIADYLIIPGWILGELPLGLFIRCKCLIPFPLTGVGIAQLNQ